MRRATVVRTILVPSIMALLGEANWYLPQWLSWLPRFQAESEPSQYLEPHTAPQPAAVLVRQPCGGSTGRHQAASPRFPAAASFALEWHGGGDMTTPAGWYDDPHDARTMRFWDGVQWTAHIAPKVASPGATESPVRDHGPSNPLHYIVPIGRSWQSVLAPYLGLLSLAPVPIIGQLLGAGGIVLGIIALRRARTGGHGTGRAIVGIVLGSIGIIAGAIFSIVTFAAQGGWS
jgi:hypothetical protein